MSMRVVIATRILPVVLGFSAAVREAGHEPVALLTMHDPDGRYGGFDLGDQLDELPPGLEVLWAENRASMAPLLDAVRPDLVVCMGFPWKIPVDALEVPSLGWLNGHPSLLPEHRGPIPMSWAIRNGDREIGITFHFMDAELDTGPIVAQRALPMPDLGEPETVYASLGPTMIATLADALERIAAGDRGTPQTAGTYESFFGEDAVWLDPSRSAAELYRLAWAWRFTPGIGTERGLLVELGGETVRVLEASLEEVEGATRIDCADAPLWIVRTEPLVRPAPRP